MKSTMFFTCLMLISFLKLAISQECMTPTQVAGTCIDIKNCQPLLELLRREGAKAADFAKKFICRIEGKNPIVCCPGKSGGSTERNLYGPLLPPQCGFSNVFRPRIVGGMPAKLNALPWMAALGFKKTPTSELEWNCGGSLISARHVLTAAHCAERNDLVVVRLGDLDLKRDDDGAHPIDLRFEKKIIHSEYNKSMHINDVAILRLERDVQFTYNIHPICLPVGKIAERDFVNTRPFLAGWGTIYLNGPQSDVLKEVQIPVVTTQTCAAAFSAFTSSIIVDDRLICTRGNGGRGVCKGDSGGPVMLPINRWFYEIGVISAGFKCAEPGFPGINSRVTSFLQFIISNLQ